MRHLVSLQVYGCFEETFLLCILKKNTPAHIWGFNFTKLMAAPPEFFSYSVTFFSESYETSKLEPSHPPFFVFVCTVNISLIFWPPDGDKCFCVWIKKRLSMYSMLDLITSIQRALLANIKGRQRHAGDGFTTCFNENIQTTVQERQHGVIAWKLWAGTMHDGVNTPKADLANNRSEEILFSIKSKCP